MATNRDGVCDTFVFYGTKGTMGHSYNVDESILMELKEEADEIVTAVAIGVVESKPKELRA